MRDMRDIGKGVLFPMVDTHYQFMVNLIFWEIPSRPLSFAVPIVATSGIVATILVFKWLTIHTSR